MPQLIRPSSVKVITQDGEVQVSIVLDLNINLNNGFEVTTQSVVEAKAKPEEKKKEENVWEIPDFESTPKIKFGKE